MKIENSKYNGHNFESIAEAMKMLENVNKKKCRDIFGFMGSGPSANWFGAGCESGQDVKDLLDSGGWDKGAETAWNLCRKFTNLPRPTSIKRRTVRGPVGTHLNQAAVYSGSLSKAWYSRRKRRGIKKSKITIAVSIDAHCQTDEQKLGWRGAAALALCNALGKSGYQVELLGCVHVIDVFHSGQATTYQGRITLKAFNVPLNIPKLAAVIGFAGFWRLVFFAGMCDFKYRVTSGLGRPDKTTPPIIAEKLTRDTYLIDGFQQVDDEQTAETFIHEKLDQLKKLQKDGA